MPNSTGVERVKHGSAKRFRLSPFGASLVGDMLRPHLNLKKNVGLAFTETPDNSAHYGVKPVGAQEIDGHIDPEHEAKQNDLDEYVKKRLRNLEMQKRRQQKETRQLPDLSEDLVKLDPNDQDDESEYEFVLESEEAEEEWESSSEEEKLQPGEQIFTQSFMNEANQDESGNYNRFSLQTPEKPLEFESVLKRDEEGMVLKNRARQSQVLGDGKVLQTDERREESYIHPALSNSSVFSNISAIMDGPNFGNQEMLSFKNDSIFEDYKDLEIEKDIDEICENSGEKGRSEMKSHTYKGSQLDSISDGEYREIKIENDVKYIQKDVDHMTKEIERIRDLIIKSPDAKKLLDSIYENSSQHNTSGARKKKRKLKMLGDEILSTTENVDNSDTYNSREISDLIQNRVSLRKFQNRQLNTSESLSLDLEVDQELSD